MNQKEINRIKQSGRDVRKAPKVIKPKYSKRAFDRLWKELKRSREHVEECKNQGTAIESYKLTLGQMTNELNIALEANRILREQRRQSTFFNRLIMFIREVRRMWTKPKKTHKDVLTFAENVKRMLK